MKIIFFGTSEFAIPALEKLLESDYSISAVVTQPDKPAGRKQKPLPSPVKVWALEHGMKVLQPEIFDSKFKIPDSDLFIVASYGQMIPKQIINLPKFGTLNIHPSLLPKYRGASPIQTAMLNGDSETGVTIIKMDEKMDHGPILGNFKFQISNFKMGYGELHDELAEVGANLLIKILPDFFAGNIIPVAQDDAKATFTKQITKENARIDWEKSAVEIDRMVRAFEEWPVAWTTLDGKRLKIFTATVSTSPAFGTLSRPGEGWGEVERLLDDSIIVNTGSGQLAIQELQLEGGKRMGARDFANGYPGLVEKVLV